MLLAPLTLLGLVLCICISPLPKDDDIYLVLDGSNAITVTADTTPSYASEVLYTSSNSAVDVQLILSKGQDISLSTETETSLLSDGGSIDSVTVTSRNETVANLLRRSHIQVDEGEMVVVDLSDGTPHITVCREYSCLRDKQITTDYPVERIPNPLMDKGEEKIITTGVKGAVTETYLDSYEYGKLVSSEFVSATDDTAVTQVLEYGTLVSSVASDDYPVDIHRNDDGSGYLIFASGDTMAFSSQVTCNASAYAIHGYTASGRLTQYGNIAVDPSVFPYGTQFYIYTNDGYLTYGMATAADCGTSIKGYKLDLWFDSYSEACWFGRRDCTVFVLS